MAYEILDKRTEPGYLGLRLTADEFLALPENSTHYELVDGVVVMSPSPAYWHQRIVTELLYQLHSFLRENPIGEVVPDIDVRLGANLVYRPDVVFLVGKKAALLADKVTEIPDLVVEIVSPSSRGYDVTTKRRDYEVAGVGEYWLIDPADESMTFLVLRDGSFIEAIPQGGRYRANAVPGFELDIERIRSLF